MMKSKTTSQIASRNRPRKKISQMKKSRKKSLLNMPLNRFNNLMWSKKRKNSRIMKVKSNKKKETSKKRRLNKKLKQSFQFRNKKNKFKKKVLKSNKLNRFKNKHKLKLK